MSSKPKIAVIGLKGLPAFGGAAAVGESIINELKNDFDFTVLSVSSHTSGETLNAQGYKQIVFKKTGNGGLNTFVYYIKCLFYCLFKERFDLIHLHHAESGFITPFLRLKYKTVVTFHGVFRQIDPKFSKLHNLFFKWSEKQNVRYANAVASVSEPDLEYISRVYKKQILHIPNGIALEEFKEIKITVSKDYIMFAAGRIYEIKGLHLVLEALTNINYKGKVIVAGDLDQVSSYKNKITELSQNLNIQYLGLIKEKQKLLSLVSGAAFFVFPSLTEAMSMMLLEVVSQKTPVIASDIPANKALFSSKEVLFFNNNNVADLAEKISYALANKNSMNEKSEKAFAVLSQKYTWKNAAAKYKSLFENLLK